jgi:hypothetical protein
MRGIIGNATIRGLCPLRISVSHRRAPFHFHRPSAAIAFTETASHFQVAVFVRGERSRRTAIIPFVQKKAPLLRAALFHEGLFFSRSASALQRDHALRGKSFAQKRAENRCGEWTVSLTKLSMARSPFPYWPSFDDKRQI